MDDSLASIIRPTTEADFLEGSEKGTLELFSENAQSKSVSSETRKEIKNGYKETW